METNDLLIQLLLYVFLPLWGIAGFVDWCCHRATHIETTSGVKESFMHSVMGVQIAIPILLCMIFEVNVAVLLVCLAALVLHEVVAHMDVRYAAPRREISIWEMHAHSYLSTLPIYMLSVIGIINWEIVIKLVSLNWSGQFQFVLVSEAHGGDGYLVWYLGFMAIFCVFPYMEELVRCGFAKLRAA